MPEYYSFAAELIRSMNNEKYHRDLDSMDSQWGKFELPIPEEDYNDAI